MLHTSKIYKLNRLNVKISSSFTQSRQFILWVVFIKMYSKERVMMLINSHYTPLTVNTPKRDTKRTFSTNNDVFKLRNNNEPAFTGRIPIFSALFDKYKTYQANKIEQELKVKEAIQLKEAMQKEVAYAESMGVKVDYASNLHAAKTINKCLTKANEKGYILPTEITSGDEYFDMFNEDYSTMALIGLKSGRMYIRNEIIPKLIDTSRTEMSKYEFLILHEIGHYNLFQSYKRTEGENSYLKYTEPYPDFENRDQIIDELGYHAISSVDELGADIFAKLMGNEPISAPIMEVYNSTCAKHLKPYFWKD